HVHLMQLSGILMVLLYLYVYFEPYRRLKSALDDGDYEAAAGHLARVRRVVGVNIILGVLTMLLGATGRYWTL
ncbi:MAG: hypothetical protein QF491_10590, partial [Alphaproteobacteria bacterium]|nr:hypothetical protein [Alphaproteobacteria bacterium]